MITPKQVSESLMMPPATVRRWAVRFEKHLSKQNGIKRVYQVSDLDTFRRIKDLSRQGFSLARIDEMLDVVETPQDQSTALLTLADFIQTITLAQARSAQMQQQIDTQAEQIAQQEERLAKLEEWITTPWYKRVGKKPPT